MIRSIDSIRKIYTINLSKHPDAPSKALVETAAELCMPVEEVAAAIEEEEGETV